LLNKNSFHTFAPAFGAKSWLKGKREINFRPGKQREEEGKVPEKIISIFFGREEEKH
jgi:hypothetical protein